MAKRIGFNYGSLKDTTAAATAQKNAEQIKGLLEQSALSVITIGQLMAETKAGFTPKVFAAWVECEFGWGESVACNYMQAARVFGDLDHECLKQFQIFPIVALARKNVPESVVREAIKRARGGEIITYSLVNQMLKAAGHKPTNPSAGKTRKPIVPTIKAEGATIVQVRESVDALVTNLTRLVLDQSDREALASKFFELAMTLRLGPKAEPAQPAAKQPAGTRKGPKSKAAKAA